MKSMVMLMAAAVPLATLAADTEIQIDSAKLRTAVPASALIDGDVTSAGDREVGEVEDIVISRDGKVQFFLLEVEDDAEALNEQPARGDEGVDAGDDRLGAAQDQGVSEDADWGDDEEFHDNEPQTEATAAEWADRENLQERGFEVDDEMRAVRPGDISFTDEADDLLLSDNAQLHPVADDEERIDGMLISEIIGMEVNLADENSFGQVEDVMLTRDGSEIIAVVVDNWDGLNKERRALPFGAAIVNYEEEEMTFPYTEEQMEGVAEFNLDAYDDGL